MSNNYTEILKGMLPEGVKPEDNLYSTLLKEVAEHGGGGEPTDTYTKEQIDNKLAKKTQDVHLYSDGTYIGYFSEKDDDEPTILTYEDVKALIENETNNVYLTNGYYSFHTKYIYRTFISGQEVGAIGFIGETQLNDNVYSYRVIINENNEVKDDEIMLAKASDMADKYGIETNTILTIESKVEENSVTLGYSGKNLLENIGQTETITGYKEFNPLGIKAGKYILSGIFIRAEGVSESVCSVRFCVNGGDFVQYQFKCNNIKYNLEINLQKDYKYIELYAGSNWAQSTGITTIFTDLMLRPASITDPTYEPYKPSVDERINTLSSLANENSVTLGYSGKNLLNVDTGTSGMSGVIFTVNADKSITLSGTAANNAYLSLNSKSFLPRIEDNKYYILSGVPSNVPDAGNQDKIILYPGGTDNCEDRGKGIILTKNMMGTDGLIRVRVKSGTNVDGIIIKPMLRPASITDDTYEPYKPSVDERLKALEAAILG